MANFKYQSLDRSKNEIRVLRILPAVNHTTILNCELVHISLDGKPEYEALSYTWGGNVFSEEITLDGTQWMVTENLKSALLALRDTQNAKILWVDAICINQEDLAERSYEVLRMLSIYQGASRVCIWLGEESDDSGLAFDHLQELALEWSYFRTMQYRTLSTIRRLPANLVLMGRFLRILFLALTETLSSYPLSFATLAILLIATKRKWLIIRLIVYALITSISVKTLRIAFPQWWQVAYWQPHHSSHAAPDTAVINALADLFRRPWWTRTWIIQEIAAAHKATVFCGPRSISLDELCDAIEHITDRVHLHLGSAPSPYVATHYARVLIFLGVLELEDMPRDVLQQRSSLLFLINQFSESEATDPKDKIYALLGVAQDGLNIIPDYTKPVEEIYIETAREIIGKTKSLDILRACQFEGKVSALPSWVPDWTVKQVRSVSGITDLGQSYGTDIIERLAKDGKILSVATFSDDSLRLTVIGIVVGTLTNAPEVQFSHGHIDPAFPQPNTQVFNYKMVIGYVILWAMTYIPGLTMFFTYLGDKNAMGQGHMFRVFTYGLYVVTHKHTRGRGESQCHYPRTHEGMTSYMRDEGQQHWDLRHWPIEVVGLLGGTQLAKGIEKVTTYAQEAEVGDQVIFLLGAKVPFLIRKGGRDGQEGVHRLVGAASFGGTIKDINVWEFVKMRLGDGGFAPEKIVLS